MPPSMQPSSQPTTQPSNQPSAQPSSNPTYFNPYWEIFVTSTSNFFPSDFSDLTTLAYALENNCARYYGSIDRSSECTLNMALAYCLYRVPWDSIGTNGTACVIYFSSELFQSVSYAGDFSFSGKESIQPLLSRAQLSQRYVDFKIPINITIDFKNVPLYISGNLEISFVNIFNLSSHVVIKNGVFMPLLLGDGVGSLKSVKISDALDLLLVNTTFSGMSIALKHIEVIKISRCNISHASGIGAVNIFKSANITVDSCRFLRNKSRFLGGALAVSHSKLLTVRRSAFINNTAQCGSAIALNRVDYSVLGNYNIFSLNTALSAGTIFFIASTLNYSYNPIYDDGTNHFFGSNIGLEYGNKFASTFYKILKSTDRTVVQTYSSGAYPIKITFTVLDYYNQIIPYNTRLQNAKASAAIDKSSPNIVANCQGRVPKLNGETQAVFNLGVASFNQLGGECMPGGSTLVHFTLSFPVYYSLSEQGFLDYHDQHICIFRKCKRGEKFDLQSVSQNTCSLCENSYSFFEFEGDTISTTCLPCPSDAIKCIGDQIIIPRGYWRRNLTSLAIFNCPLAQACNGRSSTGVASCGVGYTGPLCSVCAEGYSDRGMPSGSAPCEPCSAGSSTKSVGYLLLIILLIFLMYFIYKKYSKTLLTVIKHMIFGYKVDISPEEEQDLEGTKNKDRIVKQQIVDTPDYLIDDDDNNITSSEKKKMKKIEKIKAKLKLFVNIIQSMSQLFSIIKFRVPPFTASVMDVFGSLNFNIFKYVNFGCGVDYTKGFYFQSYFHLFVVTLFGVAISLSYFNTVQSLQKHIRYRKLISHLISYLTFIIPSMTTTTLTLFDCIDIDPLNEVDGPGPTRSLTFLRVNMAVNCLDLEYLQSKRFAFFMLCALFPVGSCSLLFFYLYSNRHIMIYKEQLDHFNKRAYLIERKSKRKVVAENENERTNGSAELILKQKQQKQKRRNDSELWDSLKPLVEPYQKNYWYWEIIEIFKRLMLSAGISIIFPGTRLQIVIGILMAIMFYRAYYRAKPFVSKSDEDLTLAGDWMLIISLLYTYTITSDGFDGVHNKELAYNMLDTMFGCLSISFVFLNVFIIIRDYFQSEKDDLEAHDKKKVEKREALKSFIATQEIHHYRGQTATFNDLYFLSYFRKKLEKFSLKQILVISFIVCNRQMVDNRLYKLKNYPNHVFFYSTEESTVMHTSNLLTPSLGELSCAFPITDKIARKFVFITRSSKITPPDSSNNNKSLSPRAVSKAIRLRFDTYFMHSKVNQNIIRQSKLKKKKRLSWLQ